MPTVASKLLSTLHYFTGLPEATLLRVVTAVVILSYSGRVFSPLLWRLLHWLVSLLSRVCRPSAGVPWAVDQRCLAGVPGAVDQPSLSVDRRFCRQLGALLRVVFPGWLSPASLLLAGHTTALVVRTCLSVCVASLEGAAVRHMVRGNRDALATTLRRWLLLALPATCVNSTLRLLHHQLALSVRLRLSEHAYSRYLGPQLVYYRVGRLDTRLRHVDHVLTDDIDNFSTCVTHLYSHLTKPLLDIVLVTAALARLARTHGSTRASLTGMLAIGVVVILSGRLLRLVSPPFGRLVTEEAALNARLRHAHARLIEHAEEVAFYRGHEIELGLLQDSCRSLVRHSSAVARQRLWYVMLEQFLMKYVWSGCGLAIISLPLLFGRPSDSSGFGERTQYVSTAKNLLQSAADAVERLMTSYKDVYELVGYTARVHRMLSVFSDVERGNYCRTEANLTLHCATDADGVARCVGNSVCEEVTQIQPGECEEPAVSSARNSGIVRGVTDSSISLRNLSIVAPSGELIVRSVSMTVSAGMHVLVTGPNGCGKSSLFRVLAGLWPAHGGEISTPPVDRLFYVPQRPYLCSGTLRDQLIYPHSVERMGVRGFTDRLLEERLAAVQLLHLLQRPAEHGGQGGWEARADWQSVLSGGEKQRLVLARLLYHRPQFALLDECSSAVSGDAEAFIFDEILAAGITLITVSHRPSLRRYHTHLLRFDGEGGFCFSELTEKTLSALSDTTSPQPSQ